MVYGNTHEYVKWSINHNMATLVFLIICIMLSAKKFWCVRWKFRKVTMSEILCNDLNSCFMRELKAGISRFAKWLLSSYSLYIKGHRAVTTKCIYLRIWRYYSTFISVFALYCKTYLIQLPFLKKKIKKYIRHVYLYSTL